MGDIGNFQLRGNGRAINWLRSHVSHAGAECLTWPFNRNRFTGYGALGFERKQRYAHRMMCELAHGPAPSSQHHVAHSCGKGHEGCVNPKHLSWATVTENLADRRRHGTAIAGPHLLTPSQIEQIRALKGIKSQYALAEMFGVKRATIQYWHRHNNEPKYFDRPDRRLAAL